MFEAILSIARSMLECILRIDGHISWKLCNFGSQVQKCIDDFNYYDLTFIIKQLNDQLWIKIFIFFHFFPNQFDRFGAWKLIFTGTLVDSWKIRKSIAKVWDVLNFIL